LYGKSQGDLNMQLASVAAKENLQLRLVDGTTLSNEATVARLAEGEMGEGSTFVSDDGERWDMQRYDSRGDNYTNALYDAMDAYMNAMATGAAEGKLAKLAGEWLTNHRPKDKDSSKLMMLREMMQTTASGEIDFETMIRNVELLRADSLEELSKTSTLAAPSALESGQRLIHDVIRHLTNTSTDAERRGQQIETTKIQQETILDGFGDDELTQFLESHNQQLKSRTPVPYWRNAFSDFVNSGSTLAQMAVLAFYIKSGVVNYVKGANAAIAEYGVITGKNISDPTSRQAIQVGMDAIKPLLKLRSRKRFHLDAGKFEKWIDLAAAVQAKSQDFADNLTGKKGVADFVSNLSDADKTKLAEGDKKLISDLKQEVQSGIRRTQGSFRHYNLSPAQQKLLKYPIGKAMLAFTAPRINELNYVWHSLRNVKDPQSRARLLRYSAMTIMTVGAMGIPLITELRALVESGTGDREETEYDTMVAKLKEFAMENGVSEDAFNETRAMVEKGALANSLTDTDLMSDDAITQMAEFFGLSYAVRMAKTASDNWSDEDKSELEKVFAVVVSASPFAKNTYRSIAESVDGRKTDSKTNYIPGSKSSVGRVIRIASGFPKHSEKETGRRRLTENLETEQGFKDAAKNFIADLGGMTRIVFGNRPVTESSKAVPSAHKQKMYEYLLANPDKVKSTIRKANELTEEAQKEIDATKDAVKEWLNTPISDVKGINPNKAKMEGTVEDVLNQVLNNNLNPDYKSTDGILKSIIGSPNDDKYHETSVYGFYRKKAIIEALKNSGLAIRANFNPTTKLASGERLKAIPDAEQATEYVKNRVISIINGTVIAPSGDGNATPFMQNSPAAEPTTNKKFEFKSPYEPLNLPEKISKLILDTADEEEYNKAKDAFQIALNDFAAKQNPNDYVSQETIEHYNLDEEQIKARVDSGISYNFTGTEQGKKLLQDIKDGFRKDKESALSATIKRLISAYRKGLMSKGELDMAVNLVALDTEIYKNLTIELEPETAGTIRSFSGQYNPSVIPIPGGAKPKQVKVILPTNGDDTIAHEMLHYTEAFLPDEIKEEIRKEWKQAVIAKFNEMEAEQKSKTRTYSKKEFEALKSIKESIDSPISSGLSYMSNLHELGRLYALSSPSEYFAVNGASILAKWQDGIHQYSLADTLTSWYVGIFFFGANPDDFGVGYSENKKDSAIIKALALLSMDKLPKEKVRKGIIVEGNLTFPKGFPEE
jgi:hypothetical protein